jgi:enoyl-CoA hydratase/carnithine racemase
MCRSADAARPLQIGLNETQVGLAVPDGIQHLMRRVIGAHQASLLVVPGAMVSAEHALRIGLVDALADDAQATVEHAVQWLHGLARLPQTPLRRTRAIARADIIAALETVVLEEFIEQWFGPDTQAALQAMAARLSRSPPAA